MTLDPFIICCWMLVWIFSITVHEAAHGWTAWRLGDATAYHGGQASLDPIPHIQREPFGMLILPLLSIISLGYPLGWASVPIDADWMQRHPRFSATVSMAGPLANLLILIVAAVILKIGISYGIFDVTYTGRRIPQISAPDTGVPLFAAKMLTMLLIMNTILFVFNMLPLPPLDGSAIPLFFLNESEVESYFSFIYNPTIQMISMLIMWFVAGKIVGPFIPLVFHLVVM